MMYGTPLLVIHTQVQEGVSELVRLLTKVKRLFYTFTNVVAFAGGPL